MKIKIVKNLFLSLFLCNSLVYAENVDTNNQKLEEVEIIEPAADCLILEDEASIICKFEMPRSLEDKQINVKWITPSGEIDRDRVLVVPSGHSSIYDYRYKDGRILGKWTFKVTYDNKEYIANFELN